MPLKASSGYGSVIWETMVTGTSSDGGSGIETDWWLELCSMGVVAPKTDGGLEDYTDDAFDVEEACLYENDSSSKMS